MNAENTISNPLSIKEKCLATCALLFTSFAFINHSAMVSILAALFILSLVIIKQQKVNLDKPTKLLIFSFVLLFVFSLPNMIMDSLYVGKIKASSLDVPSRYLLGAIALIGLSQLRLQAKHLFMGNMIGIIIAFVLYPVWGDFVLNVDRYVHQYQYPNILVGVLAVAYMSIACMVTALISTQYFYQKQKTKTAIVAIICANLASCTLVLSGSKVALIAYPLIPLLTLVSWKHCSTEVKWLMATPLITALAFLSSKETLLFLNLVFILPLCLSVIFTEKQKVKILSIYNYSSLAVIIIISITAFYYSQTQQGQLLTQKVISESPIFHRVSIDLHTMDQSNSTTQRLEMWKSGWASFKHSPWLGQGYEERKDAHNQLIEQGEVSKHLYAFKGKGSLHNEFINTMAKKGLLGLIAILTLYLLPCLVFYKLSQQNKENYHISMAGIFIVLSFFIAGLTESLLMTTFMSSFYVCSIVLTFLALHRPQQTSPQAA